jgi:hypothetical protein
MTFGAVRQVGPHSKIGTSRLEHEVQHGSGHETIFGFARDSPSNLPNVECMVSSEGYTHLHLARAIIISTSASRAPVRIFLLVTPARY